MSGAFEVLAWSKDWKRQRQETKLLLELGLVTQSNSKQAERLEQADQQAH